MQHIHHPNSGWSHHQLQRVLEACEPGPACCLVMVPINPPRALLSRPNVRRALCMWLIKHGSQGVVRPQCQQHYNSTGTLLYQTCSSPAHPSRAFKSNLPRYVCSGAETVHAHPGSLHGLQYLACMLQMWWMVCNADQYACVWHGILCMHPCSCAHQGCTQNADMVIATACQQLVVQCRWDICCACKLQSGLIPTLP